MPLTRRAFLSTLGAASMAGVTPGLALAVAPTDRRFVFIVLRGGMDGLHAVPPLGDPDYASARPGLALGAEAIPLDGFFGLHPAFGAAGDLFRAKQLLVVHAVASPYRERSHFDGQEVLESGAVRPHLLADGWLGRALAALHGDRHAGLSVGPGVPLTLRGPVPVASWAPSPLPDLPPELIDRLRRLYAADPRLSAAFEEGVQQAAFVDETLSDDPMMARKGGNFRTLAEAAGRLLAAPDGPRIAVLEAGGWDTHTGQGLAAGRMAGALRQLAEGLAAMAAQMGAVWSRTAVVAASEFGRTVAGNGTGGTDHGTAGAVLVAGGNVRGGRVVADWPGLSPNVLHQGRDLAPTTDLRSVLKGVLRDHLGLAEAVLASSVFPGSEAVPGLRGLVG
jgi:uncharacterized protein (DUF1501 family)